MSVAPLAPFEQRPYDPPALGACRHCGRLSWRADEDGPVHPCCAALSPEVPCGACEEAVRLHKRAQTWAQSRRRKGAR